MNPRRTRGTTLLELVIVVGISTLLVSGAALHFRTIRQVSDLTQRRREARQNALVALTRIARHIRSGVSVDEIKGYDPVNHDYLYVSDPNTLYTFYKNKNSPDLLYGINTPTAVLAKNVTVEFRGYNASGLVDPSRPADMYAVQVTASAAIAGTTEKVSVSTLVRLRNKRPADEVGQTVSYATDYVTAEKGGLLNYANAFGPPDEQFASPTKDGAGTLFGFARGDNRGAIKRIYAGIRIRYRAGRMKVRVFYDGTKIFENTEYGHNIPLDQYLNTWGWLWIEITSLRGSWIDTDIPRLKIYAKNEDGNLDLDFDSFAIKALFDSPLSALYWADREGGNNYPKEWTFVDSAFGAPNNVYATGYWPGEDRHSFRMTVPANTDTIMAVHAAIEGYIVPPYKDDKIEFRTALPTDGEATGTHRDATKDNGLTTIVGALNEGIITVDMSADREWTWADLSNYELRVKLKKGGEPTTFMADSVGWKVFYVPPPARGIRLWSEQ